MCVCLVVCPAAREMISSWVLAFFVTDNAPTHNTLSICQFLAGTKRCSWKYSTSTCWNNLPSHLTTKGPTRNGIWLINQSTIGFALKKKNMSNSDSPSQNENIAQHRNLSDVWSSPPWPRVDVTNQEVRAFPPCSFTENTKHKRMLGFSLISKTKTRK